MPHPHSASFLSLRGGTYRVRFREQLISYSTVRGGSPLGSKAARQDLAIRFLDKCLLLIGFPH